MGHKAPNDRRSRIHARAADILHRVRDSEVLFSEWQHTLHRLGAEFPDRDDPDRKLSSSEIMKENYLINLQRCLWEASVVKIYTCWVRTERYKLIVDSSNPALVIGDIESPEVKEALERLTQIRNTRIAHPVISATEMTGTLSMRLDDSDEPCVPVPYIVGSFWESQPIDEQDMRDLLEVIKYTRKRAKELQNVNLDFSNVGKTAG